MNIKKGTGARIRGRKDEEERDETVSRTAAGIKKMMKRKERKRWKK